LCKQLHQTLQLALESLGTAPKAFGMGLAYCHGGVKKAAGTQRTPGAMNLIFQVGGEIR
jgi:hypothetical protein